MLFNSLQFAVFFALLLVIHRALPERLRNRLLLGASLVFYSLWLPAYLLLLLGDIAVNYALLRGMVRSARPRRYLVASIVFTLGLLGVFKYAGLAVEAAIPILHGGFGIDLAVPDFFLPLGISFYSFQIIALSVDVYRGNIAPVPGPSRYLLFVSFFPQLIAGPILRGRQLLPQLERGGRPTPERTQRAVWLLTSGMVKKVIFADFLLGTFVDQAFGAPGSGSAPYHLIAVYSFAFQIYFDFSGYTDIARGLALLLGFELPQNFTEPYLARNPAEFWRRWHITLSQWLRDYLYIPLGGNRAGAARVSINLMITMLLGGLWHGAGWTFVAWGGLHGLLLVAHRLFGRSAREDAPLRLRDAWKILLCFHAVCLLWVFFRAPSFEQALVFLEALFTLGHFEQWPVLQTLVIAICVALHAMERWLRLHRSQLIVRLEGARWGSAAEGAIVGVVAALAFALARSGGEFIYFQF